MKEMSNVMMPSSSELGRRGNSRDSRDGLASVGDGKVIASEERKNLPGNPAGRQGLLLPLTEESPLHNLGLDRALNEGP